MGYLRNPEIKKDIFLHILLSAVCVLIVPSVFTAVLCAVYTAVHFFITYRRYVKIKLICRDIDNIINGSYNISLDKYREGELAVLSDQVYKVLSGLRDAQDMLKKDKNYLADSMANISHQLRTPLTSINILISTLSGQDISDERKTEIIRDIKKKLSQIEWLIDALLKISKLDTGTVIFKNDKISVADVINSAYEQIAVPMELKKQTFLYEGGKEMITGDMLWLTEAFSNIFKNCMEHVPDGGSITVTQSDTSLYTEIIICDTGEGFDHADIPHLFERFYKGKNSSEGSFGIGLSLSRMILSEHNATIKAENYPGGASFIIKFYKQII